MTPNALGKALKQWIASDVQRICDESMAEGADLEFKQALSTKTGQPDVWMLAQTSIGEDAKDKLVREIIAFANAHGGVLVLGIEETSTKPARASKVLPIPKCSELADRLRLVCRDLIEPKLATIEVEGIEMSDDGNGVVVFYVAPSRLAPHRHTRTKDCYIRRGDRSETMTMREIQDLTLFVERGLASIEQEFERRTEALAQRASVLFGSGTELVIRATCVPLVPLRIHRVHSRSDAKPEVRKFMTADHELACASHSPDRWRPVVGGTTATIGARSGTLEISLTQSGVLEYLFVITRNDKNRASVLYLGWFLGLICNAILSAHKFRSAAGAPNAEMGIDIELWPNLDTSLMRLGDRMGLDSIADIPAGRHRLPRYSLGDTSEMSPLVNEITRDLFNAGGVDVNVDLRIDFDNHLKQLGLLT